MIHTFKIYISDEAIELFKQYDFIKGVKWNTIDQDDIDDVNILIKLGLLYELDYHTLLPTHFGKLLNAFVNYN